MIRGSFRVNMIYLESDQVRGILIGREGKIHPNFLTEVRNHFGDERENDQAYLPARELRQPAPYRSNGKVYVRVA